jgi:cytidine deaminase
MGQNAQSEWNRLARRLVDRAIAARQRAYAPYSRYLVGAALLGRGGAIYDGCNVENAAYSGSICAERTAVVRAVAEGEREFDAIAVATENGGSPCGVCRQFLREFDHGHLRILIATPDGHYREHTLADLLPDSFGPEDLH